MVLSYEIVPGSVCNLSCKHCYAMENSKAKFRRNETLTKEEIKKLIRLMKRKKITKLDIGGGEPLLSANLAFTIKEFKKVISGFVGIVTNGTLLDERKIEELKEAGIDGYSISLDGINEEMHDYVRGKGSFSRTMKGIENLKKYGQPFSISFTIQKCNLNQVPNVPGFAYNLGANAVSLQTIEYWGNAKKYWFKIGIKNITTSYIAMMKMYETKPKIYIDILGPLRLRSFLDYFFNADMVTKDGSCKAGTENFILNSGGELAPCPLYMYTLKGKTINVRRPIGRIIEHIATIYENFNRSINAKSLIFFNTCINCAFRETCTPCPKDRNSRVVEECEWLSALEKRMFQNILVSKVTLKKEYILRKGEIYFQVDTQRTPIILSILESDLRNLLRCETVETYINNFIFDNTERTAKRDLDNTFKSFIRFLCKLRSHNVIELSNFWEAIEKEHKKLTTLNSLYKQFPP